MGQAGPFDNMIREASLEATLKIRPEGWGRSQAQKSQGEKNIPWQKGQQETQGPRKVGTHRGLRKCMRPVQGWGGGWVGVRATQASRPWQP